LRRYEEQMRLRVLPEFGDTKLVDVQRPDLQRFVPRLSTAGLGAPTVRGAILPLRAIFKHAVGVGDLAVNPCADLRLPAVRGRRERVRDRASSRRSVGTTSTSPAA
jgi:integrase